MADWDFDHTTEVKATTEHLAAQGRKDATTEDRLVPLERAYLVVVMGPGVGRKYEVKDEIVVGRSTEADIQLAFGDVSRAHAKVTRSSRPVAFHVQDLASRNGTLVNGLPVQRKQLRFGDRIQIGASTILLFTYHDQLEEQLLQSQKMESIGRLAGGIAHDFNNLLGAVLNNVDFLAAMDHHHTLGDAEVRSCLIDIKTAVNRAVDLTKQMLGFARRGKYEDRPTNITELVREVVAMVRRTFDRAITVQAHVEPELYVRGDRTQLHQVLMNLCLNARDAMAGGGVLRIEAEEYTDLDLLDESTKAFLDPGRHVLLVVEDTGCGMDEDTRARAFEPFFTTKPPGRGTGLGLATVYGIVKNHGGHVQLVSEPEKGSAFRIYLPAIEQGPAELDTGPQRANGRLGGGTILIVDDEEVVRKSTSRLLRHLGFDVLLACDGQEATRLFREHHETILFVLLDLIMPRMGGEDTFVALKKIDPEVKVVIASGFTDEGQARKMTEMGARGFLPKPFDNEALRAAISKVLGLKEPTAGYY